MFDQVDLYVYGFNAFISCIIYFSNEENSSCDNNHANWMHIDIGFLLFAYVSWRKIDPFLMIAEPPKCLMILMITSTSLWGIWCVVGIIWLANTEIFCPTVIMYSLAIFLMVFSFLYVLLLVAVIVFHIRTLQEYRQTQWSLTSIYDQPHSVNANHIHEILQNPNIINSPFGLTRQELNRISTSIITEDEARSSVWRNEVCAICLGNFQHGETIFQLPICLHTFHRSCSTQWLSKAPLCPCCKRNVRVNILQELSQSACVR